MHDKYKTAYYVLTDEGKRKKYDLTIGIHKYKKVSIFVRATKAIARVLLTLLDAFFSFFWCFLLVVIAYGLVMIAREYNHISFNLLYEFVVKHTDEATILAGIAAVDMLLHFHIRRLNRFLKNYKWEKR